MISEVYNEDNMIGMSRYPDKFFDLAIVDPEFGIGIGNSPRLVTDKGLKAKDWDNKPIDMKYFDELFRISKQQIIWGGNYYALPPTKHCIIWDKKQPEKLSFGMFDFAWTSFDTSVRIFTFMWNGMLQGKSITEGHIMQPKKSANEKRIHPTQKPIALYKWLLKNYAIPGDKILDTHLGSQSSRIAAYDMGFDFYGCELEEQYFNDGNQRFNLFKSQGKLEFI